MENLIVPEVLMCSVAWAVLYCVCSQYLQENMKGEIDGMPRHSYGVAMVHQLVAHPALALLIAARMISTGTGVGEWFWGTWSQLAISGGGAFERHVHYSCIGNMLKDVPKIPELWGGGVVVFGGFVLHHLVSMVGCSLFLLAPSGSGIGSSITLSAEISSGFYCVYKLYPNAKTAALYAVTQPMSMVVGALQTAAFVTEPTNSTWFVLLQILCALLIIIRGIGMWMELTPLKREILGVLSPKND